MKTATTQGKLHVSCQHFQFDCNQCTFDGTAVHHTVHNMYHYSRPLIYSVLLTHAKNYDHHGVYYYNIMLSLNPNLLLALVDKQSFQHHLFSKPPPRQSLLETLHGGKRRA